MIIPITFAVGYNGDIFDEDRIIIKSAVIPAASEYTLGDIYCYSGTTNATYTHGYIYECIADGSGYHWERLDVQPPAIVDESNIVDVVQNYAALQNYDTSDLDEGNIVIVSQDSTHDGGKAYYQWTNNAWVFKTAEEPYYSKQAADGRFVPLTRTINSKELDSDITLTASDVGALPDSTTIPENTSDLNNDSGFITISDLPTVGDGTITITQGGVAKGTFTTNQSGDTTIDVDAGGGSVSVTPRFSINNGNANAQGTMDILSYSGQTLSFKVDDGTNYAPLNMTTGWGEQVEKTSLETVDTSSLNDATYNCFIPKTGTQSYLLNNVMFVQAEKPSDTPTDTIPNMTSNSQPYGTVTCNPEDGFYNTDKLYYGFRDTQGGNNTVQVKTTGSQLIYTYDENQRPVAGLYQLKYTRNTTWNQYSVKNFTIDIYTTDNNYQRVTRTSQDSFTQNITVSLPITKIVITCTKDSNHYAVGMFQIQKPAITEEGTLWVNNGVEPLEVYARDNNAQWQPFNDVLVGTCSVNSSHNITAITNVGFNYFSTVNMHNISTTAHEDIREKIDTINTTLASVNRTGTSSYQGLTKLYTGTGTATDGTMTQNAITNELGNKVNTSDLSAVATSGSYADLSNKPTLLPNQTSGGTVVEGLFSELPAFISGLAGKVSNGTVTYKISQDETIDATVLADTYGSVAIPVPLWNIPEVVIDGNEKTITVNSSNPYVPPVAFAPADYDMQTGTLITNLNSKYQVIKIKNLNLVTSSASGNHMSIFNSADINLKIDSCNITNTTTGFCAGNQDGYMEIYYSELTNTSNDAQNSWGIISTYSGNVKSYSNTFTGLGVVYMAREGGYIQAVLDTYDNCSVGVLSYGGGLGVLYTNGTLATKVVNDSGHPTNTLGGISYN